MDLSEEEEDVDLKDLEKSSAEAPPIRFVNVVLAESIRRRASDIDLGPYERDFRVRHNVDGVLYEVMHPPLRLIFSTALRSFLRQDFNIVLVCEIRDLETSEVAVKTAFTDHLVLSSFTPMMPLRLSVNS